ncbi:MAG: GNAT family N-acetyltransferase [Microbacterium sp.]
MTDLEGDPTVTRNDEAGRYELRLGDVLAGFTEFWIDPQGRLVFPHTEIDPAFEGRGLSKELVSHAMTDAAARGETVVPLCPVVSRYLKRNEVPGLSIVWPRGEQPE